MTPTSSIPARRLRLISLLAFLGFFGVGAAWAIATPYDGGPDEQSHITRAAGVVNGDIIGKRAYVQIPGATLPGVWQTVPKGLDRVSPSCFAGWVKKTPKCVKDVPPASHTPTQKFTTAVGRYPPTYAAMVGWPLKWWPSDTGLLLARLISAALSAAFLAAAVHSILAWSRRPFLLAGLLIATTPMTLYLAGVINPNGLEITAAIAMWTALIPLIYGEGRVDRRLLLLAGISAAMVASIRPAGPVFVVLAVAVLVGTAGRARILRLLRDRRVWLTSAVLTVVGLAAAVWSQVMKADELIAVPQGAGFGVPEAMRLVLVDRTSYYFESMIGRFGWGEVGMPTAYYAVWFAVAGFLLIAAVAGGRRSDRWRLALVVLSAFLLPLYMDLILTKTMGMMAQGRYILPSAVGAALLAAYVIDERGMFTPALTRSVLGWLAVLTLPAQLVALMYTMIRYQHGLTRPVPAINPLTGRWQPPLGSGTALVVAVLGLAAIGAVIWLALRLRQPETQEAPDLSEVPAAELSAH